MIARTLWLNDSDRFATFVKLVELTGPQHSTARLVASGSSGPPPAGYLGKREGNTWGVVCAAWTSSNAWGAECGRLYFDAGAMNIAVLCTVETPVGSLEAVKIEDLMWVLDPLVFAVPVTGKSFYPPNEPRRASVKEDADGQLDLSDAQFSKQQQLALYLLAQIQLLTQICRGRSENCIELLQQSFDYSLCLNLASQMLLPSQFRAAILELVLVLFVDRHPQNNNCGAPALPHELWVEEDKGRNMLSSTPSIKARKQQDQDAFPSHFISPLNPFAASSDPLLSHPNHFKVV